MKKEKLKVWYQEVLGQHLGNLEVSSHGFVQVKFVSSSCYLILKYKVCLHVAVV